jgi:hypothetical protein
MKKLCFVSAAIALVWVAMPAIGHAQQASGKSPQCNMAKANGSSQAQRQAWADYYHCWSPARAQR